MFDTDSFCHINEVIYGETISGSNSDYGVFVLSGESKYDHEKVLALALVSTDGKTFWPITSSVKREEAFFADPLLTVQSRDLSAILQKISDGSLVISLFYKDDNGNPYESSHKITLPVETRLRFV